MSQKIVYLDCHSGISGNMFLGAMLDAGLSYDTLRDALRALPLEGYTLKYETILDHGITGTHFDVVLKDHEQPSRGFSEIVDLLYNASLSAEVRENAIAIFRILGEAEAKIHGVSLDEVHFHEVGAVDAIVDITGAAIAMEALGLSQLYASPLPLTRGHVRMAHGLMPLPAPATLEILSKAQAPWVPCHLETELVTPTGAAILGALARFETPAMVMEKIGYGFGTKQLPWPNCVRAFVGHAYTSEPGQSKHGHHHDHHHH
ncbi:MAG TPA: LarC family nickel insertion protein [Ktedonobacteraceae bacterium]